MHKLSWRNKGQARRTFFNLLSPLASEKILDVGGGKGDTAYLVYLESRSSVFVIDPNPKRIAHIKKRYPFLRSSVGYSESIPFSDSSFDKVYTTMAMHHFSDQKKAFREICRVLKPNGLLVILDTDPGKGVGRWLRILETRIARTGAIFLNPEQVVGKVKSTGCFELVESVKTGTIYIIKFRKMSAS
jgi:ubiquinone/menaquinone biosynthesis C-methylase UbiE